MAAVSRSWSVISKRFDRVRILERGLIVAGASFTLLGLTGQLYTMRPGHLSVPTAQIAIIVAVLVFTLGMLNAIISATAQTRSCRRAQDDATRGKVFGSLNMFINIAATVPVFVAGALADLLSVTRVVTIIGAPWSSSTPSFSSSICVSIEVELLTTNKQLFKEKRSKQLRIAA